MESESSSVPKLYPGAPESPDGRGGGNEFMKGILVHKGHMLLFDIRYIKLEPEGDFFVTEGPILVAG